MTNPNPKRDRDRDHGVPSIDQRIAAELGVPVTAIRPVTGGDVAQAFRCQLADGRTVFAKTHPDPRPDFFTTEAVGLEWLRHAGALSVPEVLTVGPNLLVLEWIPEGRPATGTEEALGRGLAALHQAEVAAFGRADRRSTGSLGLPNPPHHTWPQFYAECRLGPLARIAKDRRVLPDSTIAAVELIAERLVEFGAAGERPALLHGDLWAGNRLVDVDGRNWLIDPAAHGGHREFDLAMMRLFGGFAPAAFDAYQAAFPLADGWETRIPLHQLAPLIVHAVKFGGGYVAATERALQALRAR